MSHFYQDDGLPVVKQKICLATTSYDCPDASYTFSIQRSREALHAEGMQTAYYLLQGNCHVDDARNRIVQEFLASDCTDLVFLDADVSWQPRDLLKLCNTDVDVCGGVYPYRREDTRDKMPVRMRVGAEVDNGLLEVEGLPTGFMKLKRHVLERLSAQAESYTDRDGNRMAVIFERTLHDGTRWGGDLHMCNLWRDTGGEIFALYDLVLGHATKTVLKDSLGSALRRQSQTTLQYVCDRVRNNTHTLQDLTEARDYVGNQYTALEEVLALSIAMARAADGPILETGSGLTTVLMAAATDQTVYTLEHHGLYGAKVRQMAAEAGVTAKLFMCDLKDGWYDLEGKTLPEYFAFALNDGPPRAFGSRKGLFEHMSHRIDDFLCDDADDPSYRAYLEKWAAGNQCDFEFMEPRAAILKRAA